MTDEPVFWMLRAVLAQMKNNPRQAEEWEQEAKAAYVRSSAPTTGPVEKPSPLSSVSLVAEDGLYRLTTRIGDSFNSTWFTQDELEAVSSYFLTQPRIPRWPTPSTGTQGAGVHGDAAPVSDEGVRTR